ncbi:aldehyde ferredoxin oxidoreductase C-terminal domain-containing protein [Chloroflexota bacterium]
MASIGAHHLKGIGLAPGASQMYLGRPDAGDMFSTAFKGAGHAVSENLSAMANSLGPCIFLFGRDPDALSPEWAARALEAVTGIEMTAEELIKAGERIVNIQKAFNSRLGLRREHDTVCERWLNEPQIEGHSKGMKMGNYLESAKDEYYGWRGWDLETSLQTREKLGELDMTDVTRALEKEDALV